MADRGFWYAWRERVGNQLMALGKSFLADTARTLPTPLLEARRDGLLPQAPPSDPYANAQWASDEIAQELAPLTFNPYGFESPLKVTAAITNHMAGNFQQSGLLSQALLTDPKIAGPLSIRSNALVGLPVTFEPPDDSPEAKALADLCQRHFREWFPPSEHAKFHRDLIVMGFTRAQMIFLPARRIEGFGMFRAPNVHTWMPGQYVWWYWDPQRNFGRWLQSEKQGTIEPIPGNGEWIFATLSTKQPWIEGLILSLGLRYAMRLSVALNMTRFATALASGHNVYTGPVELDGKSLAFIRGQLADPNNLNLLLPSGDPNNRWEAQWVGPNSSGARDLFLAALEEQGMECAEVILGQNLTTEVKRGSHAAAKSAQLVRQDVLEYDANLDATVLREQMLKPLAIMHFSDADIAPVMKIIAEPTTDAWLQAEALRNLAVFLQVCPDNVDVNDLMMRMSLKLVGDPSRQPKRPAPPGSAQKPPRLRPVPSQKD